MSDPRYKSGRWQKLRAQVIKRDGAYCSIPLCSADLSQPGQTQVDHIHEVKDGGAFWDPANLRVVCLLHHKAKTYAKAASRLTGRTVSLDPASPNA